MIYNEKNFIKALEQSFKMYKVSGSRSTDKLKPIHGFVAETLAQIFGDGFELHFMGDNNKEMAIGGKYYPKKIDITVSENKKPVFCVGIKAVESNFKQNANNYFETMMGETANIQATQIPYAHLIILRHKTPYYEKNETEVPSKIETINDKDIAKYLKLMYDQPQAHRPNCLGILLIDVDEDTGKITATDLENSFSETTVKFLKTKLSISNFFNEIEDYKNYLRVKK